jgi:hypothetical protein
MSAGEGAKMSANNAAKNHSDDPHWITLAELSYLHGMTDERTGSLALALDRLELPAADLAWLQEAVGRALAGLRERSLDGCGEVPLTLRVLLDRRAAEAPDQPPPGKARRGWGFFLVERMPEDESSPARCPSVDVFLYLEGETQEG